MPTETKTRAEQQAITLLLSLGFSARQAVDVLAGFKAIDILMGSQHSHESLMADYGINGFNTSWGV